MLAALAYKTGKGHEDLNASTDHIAEYGLAAQMLNVVLIGCADIGCCVDKFIFGRRSRNE